VLRESVRDPATISASDANGVTADLDGLVVALVAIVVTAAATFNATFTISTDMIDGVWVPLTTTAAITGNGTTLITLGPHTTIGSFARRLRITWTVTGGSATVGLYVAAS
jgi:hypothetical protein